MTTRFNANDIIKQLLKIEGVSQSKISTELFNTRNRLAVTFANDVDMTVSNFAAVCDYLGYDVCVVRRTTIPDKFVMTTAPKRRSTFKGDTTSDEEKFQSDLLEGIDNEDLIG